MLVFVPAQPTSSCSISHRLPTSFRMKKKERWRNRSPPLLIHGGVGLDRVGGHTRAPAKLGESGVVTPQNFEFYNVIRILYILKHFINRLKIFLEFRRRIQFYLGKSVSLNY
jgi:hypothetical protein